MFYIISIGFINICLYTSLQLWVVTGVTLVNKYIYRHFIIIRNKTFIIHHQPQLYNHLPVFKVVALAIASLFMFELCLCDLTSVFISVLFQWPYGDICGIGPVGKGQGTEFNLTFRKGSGKKSETLKFSTEHRTELLTEALVRAKLSDCSTHGVGFTFKGMWTCRPARGSRDISAVCHCSFIYTHHNYCILYQVSLLSGNANFLICM